ncbi:MAG: hypothetical protein J7K54_03705 [Candidatus Aenigmarchaeota archaeon]|nr:hypothetical protein [Candidatus Aenigmarchaeota archaeon]
MGRSEEAEKEIDELRSEMQAEIMAREREAKEKLDEILSKKNMEFCSRCGKKVSSRLDWAGKCMWEGCENLLCHECWDVNKYRFCKEHAKNIVDEKTEAPEKKEIFKEEPEIKIDLSDVLEGDEESRVSKIQYYASEYWRWLQKNMEKSGPIDWTPHSYIENAKFRAEKKEGEYVIEVYRKRWLMDSVKLTIVVCPYDSKGAFDSAALSAYIHKTARRYHGYKIIVLVTDGAGAELAQFVNGFSDTSFSLFLAEPKKGHLNYNIKDAITMGYSPWFNQKSAPAGFKERLKKSAETVSGKSVVSEKAASKEFGFGPKDAHDILKSCRFLDHVKDTDTYIWKENGGQSS